MAASCTTTAISIPLPPILREVPACSDPFFTDAGQFLLGASKVWVTWVVWPERQVIDLSVTIGGQVLTASVDFIEDDAGVAVRRLGLCPRSDCENPRATAVILVNEDGWGCRRCLNVPFDSKLARPMERAIRGAQRSMVQLGDDNPNAFLRPPRKPCGMSWRKFWRLRGQLEGHVSVWWNLFCRQADATTIKTLTVLAEDEDDRPAHRNSRRSARTADRDPCDIFERVIFDRRRTRGGAGRRSTVPHAGQED